MKYFEDLFKFKSQEIMNKFKKLYKIIENHRKSLEAVLKSQKSLGNHINY